MNCEIKFLRNLNGVFYAGSLLEATVELTLRDCVKINEIQCKIIGYAKVAWTVDVNRYSLKNFTGRIEYLHDNINIIDSLDDGMELQSSQNNFDFSFQLPPSLPTSFKSEIGSIKYKIRVNIKFEGTSMSEMFFELPFIVIHPVNLNSIESIKEPIRAELTKSFNFKFAPSNIHLAVVIPRGGYCVGQMIELLIEIENLGRNRVKFLKVVLKKIVVFTSFIPKDQRKKAIEKVAEELIYNEIPPKSRREFLRSIVIPPVPPNIENCEIIKVTYELKIKAKAVGWNKSPVIRIPIVMGTVPLVDGRYDCVDGGALPPTYDESFALAGTAESSSDDE